LLINFCLQTYKIYWSLYEAADSARCMHGTQRTQHVPFNNACTRNICKWFRRSNGHL